MYTNVVAVSITSTDLKTLIETAGRSYPHDNDDCRGAIIQIVPGSTETIEVMSLGETAGFVLSNDPLIGPTFIAFRTPKVNHVWLKGSTTLNAIVLIED